MIALYEASLSNGASSDSVHVSDSEEWIHLKRGVYRGGCGPIGLLGHHIMLCGGVVLLKLPTRLKVSTPVMIVLPPRWYWPTHQPIVLLAIGTSSTAANSFCSLHFSAAATERRFAPITMPANHAAPELNSGGRGSPLRRGGRGPPAGGGHDRPHGWPPSGQIVAGNTPGGRRPDAWANTVSVRRQGEDCSGELTGEEGGELRPNGPNTKIPIKGRTTKYQIQKSKDEKAEIHFDVHIKRTSHL
ncbi:hypothetical protein M9H77_02786 [Catharanthus roseus]|uniref:Uncharacterized protein n=1 Tax=Catharanthus roseus TaxID=4058 RepID=A0ACC0C9T7_CATRO|nr:hypothetical protein M9H77_02786 [Catharanthus roseus]